MTEPLPTITPAAITLFNLVSFMVGIAGLALSLFTAWLAYKFKQDADRVNAETTSLLMDIRTDAKAVTGVVMAELTKSGDMMRSVVSGARNPAVPDMTAPATQRTGSRNATVEENEYQESVAPVAEGTAGEHPGA